MKKLAVILCAMLAFAPAPRAAAQVHVREMPETAFGFFQEVGRALSESSEYDGEGGALLRRRTQGHGGRKRRNRNPI